jgi:hypothetical protein
VQSMNTLKSITAFLMCLFASTLMSAQVTSTAISHEYPGGEFFGGASFSNSDVSGRSNSFGWQISAAGNLCGRMRLVGDFGGQSRRTNLVADGQPVRVKTYQFLWGPQFTWRRPRTTFFTNTVLGVAAAHYVTSSGDSAHPENVLAVDYGFATALGGGLDVNVGRQIAIRAFQADYILTHLRPDQPQFSPILQQVPSVGNWQNHFRLGFGLVVKVGRRGSSSE